MDQMSNYSLLLCYFYQNTFRYKSEYWKDTKEYNLPGGETGFDTQETKLPTYWKTPFSKICLGMKISQENNFIVINKQATSLFSLIADGQYRPTTLGPSKWKALIGSQANLQPNCNKEGFNAWCTDRVAFKSRIGIFGNDEQDCVTCKSRIGFGTGWPSTAQFAYSCGNNYVQNGAVRNVQAIGYILVQ